MQNSWAKHQQFKYNITHKGFSYDQVGYIPRIQHALTHANQTHHHVIHTYKLIMLSKNKLQKCIITSVDKKKGIW